MRDPNRIPEVLKEIEYYWNKYPDMRLCQLIYCVAQGRDIFDIEDEELVDMLKAWDNKKFQEHLDKCSEIVKSWPQWKGSILGLSTQSTSPDGIVKGDPPNTGSN